MKQRRLGEESIAAPLDYAKGHHTHTVIVTGAAALFNANETLNQAIEELLCEWNVWVYKVYNSLDQLELGQLAGHARQCKLEFTKKDYHKT